MWPLRICGLIGLLSMSYIASAQGTVPCPDPDNIVNELARGDNTGIFAQLLAESAPRDLLRNEGSWTVFVPVDSSLEHLPKGALAALVRQKDMLATWVGCHIIQEMLCWPESNATTTSPSTTSRYKLTLENTREGLYVSGCRVIGERTYNKIRIVLIEGTIGCGNLMGVRR